MFVYGSRDRALSDPRVLEGFLSARSLLRVVGEELSDKVLGLISDAAPARILEGEFSDSDLLHDLLIALAIEGRHSREDDEEDDSAGPDIALFIILLVEDLRGDVVRSTQFFIEGLNWVINQRCSEIYNLYLIEIFVLLQENILWLQISIEWVREVGKLTCGRCAVCGSS